MEKSKDRVHGKVDRRNAWVHGGPRAAQTLGTAVPPRRVEHEHYELQVLASGCRGGRG
jgi:hypothetical protein